MDRPPGSRRSRPSPVSVCVPLLVSLLGCSAGTWQAAGEPSFQHASVLRDRGTTTQGSLQIQHPYLAARLHLLEERSPRLRTHMDGLRHGELPVYITVAEPLLDADRGVTVRTRMPDFRLGEFRAIQDPETGELVALVVRVNLRQIAVRQQRWLRERAHRETHNPDMRAEFEAAVDGILIHELWGHLIPVALRRSTGASCPDPLPGQADLASCVLQRENELRLELGLQPRTRYRYSRYARP
jgi:hypothetical protein